MTLTDAELCSTFDGRVWASEFVARFGGDEDLMHAWFANAIMAGHDIGRRNQESELDSLRAENEKLSTRVTELEVGEACFTPTGADELLRLRAENETLRQQLDGDWPEARLSDAYEKLAVKRDAEIATLRATALTASEAEMILGLDDNSGGFLLGPTSKKLNRIAHPEPQEKKMSDDIKKEINK